MVRKLHTGWLIQPNSEDQTWLLGVIAPENEGSMHTESQSVLLSEVQERFWLGARLPSLPFRMTGAEVRAFEFHLVIGGSFALLARKLADRFGDRSVSYWAVDQSPSLHEALYGELPGFQFSPGISESDFMSLLDRDPQGNLAGNLLYASDVFAACGDSQRWAVWAQRDWEIAVLASSEGSHEILDTLGWANTPFSERIDELRGPTGWVRSLDPATARHMELAVDQIAGGKVLGTEPDGTARS